MAGKRQGVACVVSGVVDRMTRREAGGKHNDQPQRQREHGRQLSVALRYLNVVQRLIGCGGIHARQASKRVNARGSIERH